MIYSSEQRTNKLLELIVEGCGNDELELFNSIDTSEGINFSKKFERKMQKLLRNGKPEPFGVQFKRVLSRVAIVCLVVLSLSFTAMMSVSAIRQAIWETIVEWYNSYFEVTVDDGDDTTENQTITEIKEIHKPTVLPEGVEEEFVVDNKRWVMIDYYEGNEWIASFNQKVLDETNFVHINSEEVKVFNERLNEFDITVIEYLSGDILMFWSDNVYFFTLEGYDLETLNELISTIK